MLPERAFSLHCLFFFFGISNLIVFLPYKETPLYAQIHRIGTEIDALGVEKTEEISAEETSDISPGKGKHVRA